MSFIRAQNCRHRAAILLFNDNRQWGIVSQAYLLNAPAIYNEPEAWQVVCYSVSPTLWKTKPVGQAPVFVHHDLTFKMQRGTLNPVF